MEFFKAVLENTKKKWYLFPSFFLWELFKDRLFGWININARSGTFMNWLNIFIKWMVQDTLGLAGVMFIGVLIFIVIHSYKKEWKKIAFIVATIICFIIIINSFFNLNQPLSQKIPEDISETELKYKIIYPQIERFIDIFGEALPTSTMPNLSNIKPITGTLYEDNFKEIEQAKNTKRIMFGDSDDNKEFRGFISFNISKFPQNIVVAELYLTEPATNGDMNPKYFKNVLIEAVDIGNYLDETDFNRDKIVNDNNSILLKDINNKSINVTKAVIDFLRNGRDIATFRLRFIVNSDNNNEEDKATIILTNYKPFLLIKYESID